MYSILNSYSNNHTFILKFLCIYTSVKRLKLPIVLFLDSPQVIFTVIYISHVKFMTLPIYEGYPLQPEIKIKLLELGWESLFVVKTANWHIEMGFVLWRFSGPFRRQKIQWKKESHQKLIWWSSGINN